MYQCAAFPDRTPRLAGHFLPAVDRLHRSVAELDDSDSPNAAVSSGTRANTRAWLQRAVPGATRVSGGQNGGSASDRCAFPLFKSMGDRETPPACHQIGLGTRYGLVQKQQHACYRHSRIQPLLQPHLGTRSLDKVRNRYMCAIASPALSCN